MSPGKPMFNQIITAELNLDNISSTDVSALCEAWIRLQQKHPVLGSSIAIGDDSLPWQQYAERVHPMEFVELPTSSQGNNATLDDWITARGNVVLDLSSKLADAVLIRWGNNSTLFFNIHHLIADALSIQWILKTLTVEFNAVLIGEMNLEPSTNTEIEDRQFSEYAQKLLKKIGPNSQPATVYESHSTPSSSMPVFYGRVNSYPITNSERKRIPLSAKQNHEIRELVSNDELRQINENLFFMCFHTTALAIYLHKVTGEKNLTIEAPISGRIDPQSKHIVGNLIEMIQVKIIIPDNASLLELYQTVRNNLFTALAAARSGCTTLIERGIVHGVINFITSHTDETPDLLRDIRWHHSLHSDLHHPLRIHVADWNRSGFATVDVDFNEGFLPKQQHRKAIEHITNAYTALINDRQTPLDTLSILGSEELWKFEGPYAQSFNKSTGRITDRVDAFLLKTPDAIAIRSKENGEFTYRQLHRESVAVSKQLQTLGIGHGNRVAVVLSRSKFLPIILLGILRSGACYIPIDHSQPSIRINEILADSQPSCVIVDELTDKIRLSHGNLVTASYLLSTNCLLSDTERQDSYLPVAVNTMAQNSTTLPTDPAYLIYTSGSTGKPKGVVVSHHALMAYLDWAAAYYSLDESIVMPFYSSIGFDMTVTSLFLPLICGGTVQIFNETIDNLTDNAIVIFDVMNDSNINTVKLTPSHLSMLMTQASFSTSIRQLIVGGEDLSNRVAEAISQRFNHAVRITNEYGPSEATVGCIVYDWKQNTGGYSVPIGLPIKGMSAYILDDTGQPQFEGVSGELFVSGKSLAEGYWNNQAQTESVFLANPWNSKERMYRTGDLVRVENEQLVYLGRIDTQIKRNGYRIELLEIEAMLRSHPAITDCVVKLEIGEYNSANSTNLKPHSSHVETNSNFPQKLGTGRTANADESFCTHCGLSSRHPQGTLNRAGVCALCVQFTANKSRINDYFNSLDDLYQLVTEIKHNRRGDYDAVVLLSGGKDSTYTISKLVDMGLKVYAFSLDNGFLSEHAKDNIDRVCEKLGIAHHYASTNHMDAIFADSLTRYSNVCQGCFKTIYSLSLAFADQHSIDYIFTGLSRGQLFETRLNNELFSDSTIPLNSIDEMVEAARIQYHAVEDAPHKLLALNSVNNGTLAKKIAIVDFYRYCHVELSDMVTYLKERVGWVRPPDTGRSTNCLINDVGIHIHKIEQGFHNYSLPYSWDVRLGHKQREEALEELEDDIDLERVNSILDKIGYRAELEQEKPAILRAFITCSLEIEEAELQTWLQDRLPAYMHPNALTILKSMPLNANGKIDRKALYPKAPNSVLNRPQDLTQFETRIADLWMKFVNADTVTKGDNFFKLGGDSLSAIRCVVEMRNLGIEVEPADLFRVPVLEEFCILVQTIPSTLETSKPTPKYLAPKSFSTIGNVQRSKLQALLAKESPDHK